MIEKILERLDEEREYSYANFEEYVNEMDSDLDAEYDDLFHRGLERAKKIVRRVAKEFGKETNVLSNGWIPVEVAMPEEHESIFAKFKGTDKWDIGMFEKVSDDVNVTVEYTDGTRKTKTLHTCDGIWKKDSVYAQCNVIAWQPLPKPYRKGE